MIVNKASGTEENPVVPGRGRACSILVPPQDAGCEDRASSAPASPGSLSLWLWVVGGFLFLGVLWTGMVIATRHADTRTVPLVGQEVKS
jgi:hypothetical protein